MPAFAPAVNPGTRTPVAAFTAASGVGPTPPTVIWVPPRNSVLPDTARSFTVPVTMGAKAGSRAPVVRSKRASRVRGAVKLPPR